MAHMHYKSTGKTHSFRGLLVHSKQREISIQGSVGATAWRITKFAVMSNTPTTESTEAVMLVWRERQDAVSYTVDFGNEELLAVGVWTNNAAGEANPENLNVIFDNTLFVRNIFITFYNSTGSADGNYYIELEEVKVGAAGMGQLAVAAARRRID